MITDEPTPCFGRGKLFDSTAADEHAYAATLCRQVCPMLAECGRERDQLLKDPTFRLGAHGTWAGKLLNPGGERNRKPRVRCGTEKGYSRHRTEKTPACDACKAAHAKKRSDQRKAKKEGQAA